MQAVIPENDLSEGIPYAPFLRETFEEFQNWMQKDESQWLFTQKKRAQYIDWIQQPDRKPPPGPDQRRLWNQKLNGMEIG